MPKVFTPNDGDAPLGYSVANQEIGQRFRTTERDAVTTGDLIGGDAQALLHEPAKEGGGE